VEAGTVVSSVSIGRDTVTGAGDGVEAGDGVGVCAEATPLISNEAVTASVTLFQVV
jgi:hypothetical protein